MGIPQSDAFVFFGATGDLAFKKIFSGLRPLAFLRHSCLQPFLDQAKNAAVSHSVLDELHGPFVTHSVEKVPNVRVEYPVHPLRLDSHRKRIQRLMRLRSGRNPYEKPWKSTS
jgi:hypothetical protein